MINDEDGSSVTSRQWKSTSCEFYGYWQRLPCLCASPIANQTAVSEARKWLDDWREKDLARRAENVDGLWFVSRRGSGRRLCSSPAGLFGFFKRRCRQRGAASGTPAVPPSSTRTADTHEDAATGAHSTTALRNAQRAASRRRCRMNAVLIYIGWLCVIVGQAPTVVQSFAITSVNVTDIQPDPLIGPFNMYQAFGVGPGMTLILLSVRPTDVNLIRGLSCFFFIIMGFLSIQFFQVVLGTALGKGDWLAGIVYGSMGVSWASSPSPCCPPPSSARTSSQDTRSRLAAPSVACGAASASSS